MKRPPQFKYIQQLVVFIECASAATYIEYENCVLPMYWNRPNNDDNNCDDGDEDDNKRWRSQWQRRWRQRWCPTRATVCFVVVAFIFLPPWLFDSFDSGHNQETRSHIYTFNTDSMMFLFSCCVLYCVLCFALLCFFSSFASSIRYTYLYYILMSIYLYI